MQPILNLLSLFTLFANWTDIPNLTKLNVLDKLASTHPDLVMQAFKDLSEPQSQGGNTQEREILGYCKTGQLVSAIKAFRTWKGAGLKEAKDVIDYVRTGDGFYNVIYEHEEAASKLRDLYIA